MFHPDQIERIDHAAPPADHDDDHGHGTPVGGGGGGAGGGTPLARISLAAGMGLGALSRRLSLQRAGTGAARDGDGGGGGEAGDEFYGGGGGGDSAGPAASLSRAFSAAAGGPSPHSLRGPGSAGGRGGRLGFGGAGDDPDAAEEGRGPLLSPSALQAGAGAPSAAGSSFAAAAGGLPSILSHHSRAGGGGRHASLALPPNGGGAAGGNRAPRAPRPGGAKAGKKKAASGVHVRSWLRIDEHGETCMIQADKYKLTHKLGVQARARARRCRVSCGVRNRPGGFGPGRGPPPFLRAAAARWRPQGCARPVERSASRPTWQRARVLKGAQPMNRAQPTHDRTRTCTLPHTHGRTRTRPHAHARRAATCASWTPPWRRPTPPPSCAATRPSSSTSSTSRRGAARFVNFVRREAGSRARP
jgi:hypothetical protein